MAKKTGKLKATNKRKPGTILRYVTNVRTPPRRKAGEILCHNHIAHLAGTSSGWNGFCYFVCDGSRGHGWALCPCGWMPHFGKHYARPDHAAYQRKRRAAGKPMTMWWSPEEAPPPGCKRVGRDRIAS